MVTTALLLSPLLYYINLFKLLSCFLNGLNPFSYSAPHPTGQGGDFEQEATWHLVGKCSLTKSSYAYATTFNSVTEWTVCAKGNVETINQGLTLVLQVLDKDQTFRQEDLRTLFLLCFFFEGLIYLTGFCLACISFSCASFGMYLINVEAILINVELASQCNFSPFKKCHSYRQEDDGIHSRWHFCSHKHKGSKAAV